MKKFTFPPERVLDWRRLQAQMAEAELERLHQARRALVDQKKALAEDRAQLERELLEAKEAQGWELAALEAFQNHSDAEAARLDQLIRAAAEKIQAHADQVTAKRRDARLLEKLKHQRLQAWHEESAKETDQLAEETYLARWNKK